MDSLLHERLRLLYEELHAFDRQQPDRLNRWRNLEPASALLLSMLVRSKQAKQVLEIGTSNGYSTLWLADALETTDGTLTSLDIDEQRTRLAQQYLRNFKLDHRVTCLTMDAGLFLHDTSRAYDLIFLDAERRHYSSYWPALQKMLTAQAGSLLVVDNVMSHREEVAGFLALIDADAGLLHTILPVGAGLLLVTPK